jgi:hypothetical protein
MGKLRGEGERQYDLSNPVLGTSGQHYYRPRPSASCMEGLVKSRADIDVVAKKESSLPERNRNRAVQPLSCRCTELDDVLFREDCMSGRVAHTEIINVYKGDCRTVFRRPECRWRMQLTAHKGVCLQMFAFG